MRREDLFRTGVTLTGFGARTWVVTSCVFCMARPVRCRPAGLWFLSGGCLLGVTLLGVCVRARAFHRGVAFVYGV